MLHHGSAIRAYRHSVIHKLQGPTFCCRLFNDAAVPADNVDNQEAYRRQRKTEWKRHQRGQTFLDHLIVTVRGGKGGDGCAAFHREKFMPHGPPSGGNGGKGGDVYILPTSELTSLSSISKRIRGVPGGNGKGSWMHGKNGTPTVVRVPFGTVVQEISGDDSRRAQDEWEAEDEGLQDLSEEERVQKMRDRRWVHYPGAADDNVERDAFKEAERVLYRQERDKRILQREQRRTPIALDLESITSSENSADFVEGLGYLMAAGGDGGLGNPAFLTADNRSPKFATRGHEGRRITLSLELKILADVGLVGYPNAGKSTLLRALTGGRAQTEVAGYAFTTLNPTVAVVRMNDDGDIIGAGTEDLVVKETEIEEREFEDRIRRGDLANALTRNQQLTSSSRQTRESELPEETFRFTVADNPGLISRASENVGLGHSFLRAIERSLALVYVVDLSGAHPQDELQILRDELEAYKPGLSSKARMVIANKADLLTSDELGKVEEARAKLRDLEIFVKQDFKRPSKGDSQTPLDIIPISAKYSQNLRKVLRLMRNYVEAARA